MPAPCQAPIVFPPAAAAPTYFPMGTPGVAIAPGFPGSTIRVGPPNVPAPMTAKQTPDDGGFFLGLVAFAAAAGAAYVLATKWKSTP